MTKEDLIKDLESLFDELVIIVFDCLVILIARMLIKN